VKNFHSWNVKIIKNRFLDVSALFAVRQNHLVSGKALIPIPFENSVDFTPAKPLKIKLDQYKLGKRI